MLQITDNATEQQLLSLFRFAFRPFFLAGTTFSLLSMLLWVVNFCKNNTPLTITRHTLA
ncbi:NnrS family protein [Psychromonas antarctica]|uniref:NnrS family protein n=1 Tax=Psychromonas antarctica TaxID=67573 RepID=UPI001EE88536|nr:NnrS family protein [Psychromonas antarctica]MCG6199688.1 NnrS family protein [Psychromonas antarctica]